jgi:hypothetical protein
MWAQPEKQQSIENVLRDPNTPTDILRRTALEEHELIAKAYVVIDAALEVLLIFGFGAAVLFAYLAYVVSKNRKEVEGAP